MARHEKVNPYRNKTDKLYEPIKKPQPVKKSEVYTEVKTESIVINNVDNQSVTLDNIEATIPAEEVLDVPQIDDVEDTDENPKPKKKKSGSERGRRKVQLTIKPEETEDGGEV
ncbi:hypothetical protein [Acinetobacter sp.]|uniref:hypothetical protein n=1 Tax=Acinetobacter sp. TaxID=472 RepID=UPI003D05FC6D